MPDLLHILPEWLELVFLVAAIGTVVCELWLLPAELLSTEAGGALQQRLRRLLLLLLPLLLLSSVGELFERGAEMSGREISEAAAVLPTVLSQTHLGKVWIVRVVALTAGIAVSALTRRRKSPGGMLLLLALLLVVGMTKSASGHAADQGDFSLAEWVDLAHLTAVAVWGGGLFTLSTVLFPDLLRPGRWPREVPALVASRFSRSAGIAVGVIIVTAVYNSFFLVGSYDALITAPYGLILILKSYLFFMLLCLGANNRFLMVPLMQESAGLAESRRSTAHPVFLNIAAMLRLPEAGDIPRRFLTAIRIEAFLVLLVLFCSSLLRHEVPARHYLHLHSQGSSAGESHLHHQ